MTALEASYQPDRGYLDPRSASYLDPGEHEEAIRAMSSRIAGGYVGTSLDNNNASVALKAFEVALELLNLIRAHFRQKHLEAAAASANVAQSETRAAL